MNPSAQLALRRAAQVPVTTGFVLLCVIIYLVTAWQSGSLGENLGASALANDYALNLSRMDGGIADGFARVVLSWFLHAGPEHLVMNCIMFYLLGAQLERYLSRPTYVLVILAAGLMSSALVLVCAPPYVTTGGASGVVYGLLAVFGGVTVHRRESIRPLLVFLAINVGASLILPNISLWGHLGGLAAGVLCALPLLGGRWHTSLTPIVAVGTMVGAACVIVARITGAVAAPILGG